MEVELSGLLFPPKLSRTFLCSVGLRIIKYVWRGHFSVSLFSLSGFIWQDMYLEICEQQQQAPPTSPLLPLPPSPLPDLPPPPFLSSQFSFPKIPFTAMLP